MKKCLYVLQLCLFILCSCSSDSDEENGNGSNGFAPEQIANKTLTLKKSNGDVYLSAEHLTETNVLVNSDLVDYGKYPPSYSYSTAGNNKATYHLDVTKKVYIPYYGTYTYAKFAFDINLSFTSKSGGTYNGTQINGEGKKSSIVGNFMLN